MTATEPAPEPAPEPAAGPDDAAPGPSGSTARPPAVVVPAGAPLVEAAEWVGHACWAELRFHGALTRWLAAESDPVAATLLWRVRSHRAEVAEQWHRRLPELREMPRADFVRAGDPTLAALFDHVEALGADDEPAPTDDPPGDPAGPDDAAGAAAAAAAAERTLTLARVHAAASLLSALRAGYEARVSVAVGPADGPVAATLAQAIRAIDADLAALGGSPTS
jgi:hypothetical protein